MSVLVEFEDGLLQNSAIYAYVAEMKNKVPDVVQDKETKSSLMELKKELNANVAEIDSSAKKQIDELVQVFKDKNAEVWEARDELANLVKKITEVNAEFDARRKRESFEAIDLFVRQANVTYQLTGTQWQLNAGRFASVDALTSKGELKKSIEDKITAAALSAQQAIEQEELLAAARRDKLEKEKQLAEKERELRQREADIERQENADMKAMQAKIDEERAAALAKERALNNVRNTYENKQDEIMGRLTALENQVNPEKSYSGQSVLNMIKKIKEMLR